MTLTPLTYGPDTLARREAVAHNELLRMTQRYPDSQTTYEMVLAQLNLVRDLNMAMDRDEQLDQIADKHGIAPDHLRLLIKRENA